ncbi:phospholipase D-like domain-containing protein [Leptolyngbya sp. AN02str]|uniref:phospholipase D-like domain-containing protein n=1 Tax=Leptolyngbya sp. AN02str TaxID=3423363 RepID=UPI003D3172EA
MVRQIAQRNGVTVKAYTGTTGVLLAMNVEPDRRTGLLGFAIKRRDGRTGRHEWLMGALPFPHMRHKPGTLLRSNIAPLQKFRWSDYRVYPDTSYEYAVYPVYGTAKHPELGDEAVVAVRTASMTQGDHQVIFNRAAAASQAFSRKFPQIADQLDAARRQKQPAPPLPPQVLEWLTRGVLERILSFIQQAADPTWALDVAIYEYQLPDIVDAIAAAHARGVAVRVVYHAKPNDPATTENEHALESLPLAVKQGRITYGICHHKFMVLSRIEMGDRVPEAVLCGSTNFTHNGVYRQANVVHVVCQSDIAQAYLALFDGLFRGDSVGETRRYINRVNAIAPDQFIPSSSTLFAGFSPRTGQIDLNTFIQLVRNAKRDVLFCTAFRLYAGLEEAFLGEPHDSILRYGLQNSRSIITGIHADRTADFTATAMLNEGLEGFLKESTAGQRGNILIHTKLIVIDFTSDHPIVISGSHNFSSNASRTNDENFLIIQGDPRVADCYGCELMRLYDHYRFRFRVRQDAQARSLENSRENSAIASSRRLTLSPNDGWTTPYFTEGNLKQADRLRFSGC